MHPLEFMIRGVSFDGRQENVVQLVPGTKLTKYQRKHHETIILEAWLFLLSCMHAAVTRASNIYRTNVPVGFMGAGQPVQFVPEPDNPFDSNAILIKTLAGLELGYVPRELNDLFPNQVLLGEVVLMGMAKTVELCGAMVRTSSALAA